MNNKIKFKIGYLYFMLFIKKEYDKPVQMMRNFLNCKFSQLFKYKLYDIKYIVDKYWYYHRL